MYEVCTDVARCFPNILDAMVLENINLSEDEIGRPPLWSNEIELDFCHQLLIYVVSKCIFQPQVIFICALDLKVFNFSEKMT
jgi:hypothetical protein